MTLIDRNRWQALEPLLDQALEMALPERGRWLDELSARSPALAADLTSLLAGEVAADWPGGGAHSRSPARALRGRHTQRSEPDREMPPRLSRTY